MNHLLASSVIIKLKMFQATGLFFLQNKLFLKEYKFISHILLLVLFNYFKIIEELMIKRGEFITIKTQINSIWLMEYKSKILLLFLKYLIMEDMQHIFLLNQFIKQHRKHKLKGGLKNNKSENKMSNQIHMFID